MNWEKLLNSTRFSTRLSVSRPPQAIGRHGYRITDFQDDFGRIVHSSAFRRLKNKTQVHTFPNNDYVRDRITHSYEVAHIGRNLGAIIGKIIEEKGVLPDNIYPHDLGEIVASACLAHDLGNPPFGHVGEQAIKSWCETNISRQRLKQFVDIKSRDYDKDFLFFDGNAQSFRILTRLQGWRKSGGLQLTYATLATMCKYPWSAANPKAYAKQKYCFFQDDLDTGRIVFEQCGLQLSKAGEFLRHPLSYVVEAADDIAYLTTDIQDGFRARLIDFSRAEKLLMEVSSHGAHNVRYPYIKNYPELDKISYLAATSARALEEACVDEFDRSYNLIMDGKYNGTLTENCDLGQQCDAIRREAREKLHLGEGKSLSDVASIHVIHALLDKFSGPIGDLIEFSGDKTKLDAASATLLRLLPTDNEDAASLGTDSYRTFLHLTDFISGMTDRYAVELYQGLYGHGLAYR